MTALSEYMHEQMPSTPATIHPPTNMRILDPWRGTKKSIQHSIHSKLQRLGNKWMRSVGADPSNAHITNMINAKLRAMEDVFARGHMGDPKILNDQSRRRQRPPHPSHNRKLRAMANIIRPRGCKPLATIRAVRHGNSAASVVDGKSTDVGGDTATAHTSASRLNDANNRQYRTVGKRPL